METRLELGRGTGIRDSTDDSLRHYLHRRDEIVHLCFIFYFEGVFEGIFEGVFEGIFEGVFEGIFKGVFEGGSPSPPKSASYRSTPNLSLARLRSSSRSRQGKSGRYRGAGRHLHLGVVYPPSLL